MLFCLLGKLIKSMIKFNLFETNMIIVLSVKRDERSQLMVGVRRANHQQTNLPSSVLSADSMHFGVLAAAAHAAANRSPFTIFYNPRLEFPPFLFIIYVYVYVYF